MRGFAIVRRFPALTMRVVVSPVLPRQGQPVPQFFQTMLVFLSGTVQRRKTQEAGAARNEYGRDRHALGAHTLNTHWMNRQLMQKPMKTAAEDPVQPVQPVEPAAAPVRAVGGLASTQQPAPQPHEQKNDRCQRHEWDCCHGWCDAGESTRMNAAARPRRSFTVSSKSKPAMKNAVVDNSA